MTYQTETRQIRIKLEIQVTALMQQGKPGEISELLDIPLDVSDGAVSAFLTTRQVFEEERKYATYIEQEIIDRTEDKFNRSLVRSLFREKQRHG